MADFLWLSLNVVNVVNREMENVRHDILLRAIALQEANIADRQAEKARLPAENAELRALVAGLQQRVAELEAKPGAPSGKAVPDFVRPNRKRPKEEGPRKKRAENFARRREEPTRRTEHAVKFCTRS